MTATSSISEEELYDGPLPYSQRVNGQPLFAKVQPEQKEDEKLPSMALLVNLALEVLSTRLIALMAMAGAIGIWCYAVYSPDTLRLIAGGGYSIGVLIPAIYAMLRKG